MTPATPRPIEYATVLIRMSPELVAQLTDNGWLFGEADSNGFYSPSVRSNAHDALLAALRALVEACDSRAPMLEATHDLHVAYEQARALLRDLSSKEEGQ